MGVENGVPGFAELDDWPIRPSHPVRICGFGRYRDGGPRGGTFYVELKDVSENLFPFFFDRFLGRLCYGSSCEAGEDAAFLHPGSRIEAEAFSLIETLAQQSTEYAELLACLNHAKTWASLSECQLNS